MKKGISSAYGRVAQVLHDRLLLNPQSTLSQKLEARCLLKIRQRMCEVSDPLVRFEFEGHELTLPFSHQLPLFRKNFPDYSHSLGQVAEILHAKYPDFSCIDIGANVGDSVAILRRGTLFPILAIEADNFYYELLEKNTDALPGVELEHALVADCSMPIPGKIVRSGGTGRIVANLSRSSEEAPVRSLDAILELHPKFARPRLLKLDTDGYDCSIIMSIERLLTASHCAIYFEYDPTLFHGVDERGKEVFSFLQRLGYEVAAFYCNTGPYAFTVNLDNISLLEDVYAMSFSPGGASYYDVAVFHRDDADMASALRSAEISKSLSP